MRVGCCSSVIFGGIISKFKFAYDIYGGAVDCAEALASVGPPLSLSICKGTFETLLDDLPTELNSLSATPLTQGETNVGGTTIPYVTFNNWNTPE